MTRIRLKYVSADTDRHGKVRYYFRKRGAERKVRLHGKPGDAEFMAGYHACLAGQPHLAVHVPSLKQIVPVTDKKSLRWLCQQYLTSRHFKALDVKTRRPRQSILAQLCELPISATNRQKMGEAPFEEMPSRVIRRIRDRHADRPEAANNWLKAIKALFKWGVEEEVCTHNPAKDVPKIKVSTEGFHTWTIEEMRQFEASHPVGSQARLAMALLAYTGQRKSDVVRLGPQHIKDGRFRFTQKKNEARKPVMLEIPILPELSAVIAATPCGHLTYLVNASGQAWSADGFGNKFRGWCIAAGLPNCSSHGLRKAAACAAAEGGATEMQMMAIFGWRSPDMARRYTLKASQRSMADASMHLLGGR